jgi:hypothetical protein
MARQTKVMKIDAATMNAARVTSAVESSRRRRLNMERGVKVKVRVESGSKYGGRR